ncbi:nitroreductase family protein [Paenibacillus sp. FSL H7-0350]|uniref:nitroreductase family protein n=1 Tax=Paenibacillus sp. FSL H7-0350 TaxID=2975345 RepID=UPI0031580D14
MNLELNSENRVEALAKLFEAEKLLENFQDRALLDQILKFHQKTTWQYIGEENLDLRLTRWLELVQFTDVLPEYYEQKIDFNVKKIKLNEGRSKRTFKKNGVIDFNQLGEILYESFGLSEGSLSKPYPSAGALYPIIPLLLVLDENAVERDFLPGSYVFDSHEARLLMIKKFDQEEILKIKKNIYGESLSGIAICYSIDIRRSIAKYRSRGYRHALIEVGLMAQSFRSTLERHKGFGECTWSGFNDNALSSILGLSPRLSPVVLVQWFGEIS